MVPSDGKREPNGMSHTILVVDDEEEIRRLLQRTLVKYGYHAIGAEDAIQGLVQLQDHQVDLVITDIRMPGIDGLDFIEQIHDLNPDLPVIVITGFGTYQTAMEAVRRGAFFFISKPFDNETMIDTVKKGLRIPHAARKGATATLDARLLFSVTAPPSAELSEGVIASLLPLLKVYGYDDHTANVRLPFVIDEMITRALRAEVLSLKVEATMEEDRVDLTFGGDGGEPYDPESLPASAIDFDLTEAAGVGLLVANEYSDQLVFMPQGKVARATFYRNRPAPVAD